MYLENTSWNWTWKIPHGNSTWMLCLIHTIRRTLLPANPLVVESGNSILKGKKNSWEKEKNWNKKKKGCLFFERPKVYFSAYVWHNFLNKSLY